MTVWLQDFPSNLIDVVSLSLILATINENLPHIASLISIVWVIIRIAETCTVRNWFARLRRRPFNRTHCLLSGGDKDA